MSDIERQRARNALQRVRDICNELGDAKSRGSYRSYVDALGAAIVMNGLGQALATERAAADEQAHRALYESLQQWLCGDSGVYKPEKDLLDEIINSNQSKYIRAQAEALAWLEWHKKLCRAELPKDATENDGG